MGKTALVTGVMGQDGAYLARLLLEKGYRVVGTHRRSSTFNPWRLEHLGIADNVELIHFDLVEHANMARTLRQVRPDEIYNLAAMSFVAMSFERPTLTGEVDGMGVARLLEATLDECPQARFYQASSSEMFGKAREVPQTEETPFYPRSPYGTAKVFAHWMTVNYREAYGLHASSGILFNHESPLRSLEFVTRKITASLASVRHGHQKILELGNMDSERDWGFAEDYVEGMHLMLQQEDSDDYVLATGQTRTVRHFVEVAAGALDFEIVWEGAGQAEIGRDRKSGSTIVRVNPAFYRPAEAALLVGQPEKARERLGWRPRTSFEQLVEKMARADDDRARQGRILN